MIENKEPPSEERGSKPSDTQPDSKAELVETAGNLADAAELLQPGQPLVLIDGMIINDSGCLIMSQYVDIGVDKLQHRPSVLVKAIEAKYGLEHAVDIQVSAPYRFRDYGETLIRDDQEGRARHKTKTENPPRSYEELNREQERALQLLGQENLTISNSASANVHTQTESMTFGDSSWIYCTSIGPSIEEWSAWRASLPDKYDHESVIRQPARFAFALGEMFVEQKGPQEKKGHFTHNSEIRSFHNNQMVYHGPVWYTDDVLGFIKSHEGDPLYGIYQLFVKYSDFQDQREYRRLVNLLIWLLVIALFLGVLQFMFEGAKWVYAELTLFGIWTWLHNEEIRTLALSVLCTLVPVFAGMDHFRLRRMRKTILFLAAHIPDDFSSFGAMEDLKSIGSSLPARFQLK